NAPSPCGSQPQAARSTPAAENTPRSATSRARSRGSITGSGGGRTPSSLVRPADGADHGTLRDLLAVRNGDLLAHVFDGSSPDKVTQVLVRVPEISVH